jgi:hypothetical protein
MRLFQWPPIVDMEAREIRIAPIHLLAVAAGAAVVLGLGPVMAVLS